MMTCALRRTLGLPSLALALMGTLSACNEPASSEAADAPAVATQPTEPATSADDPGDPDDRLTGTWKATGVETPAGPAEMTVIFRENETGRVVAVSELPFMGQLKEVNTGYTLKDGKIHCEADGRVMPYSFEGQHTLLLQYEADRTIRFTRIAEEDAEGVVKSAPAR